MGSLKKTGTIGWILLDLRKENEKIITRIRLGSQSETYFIIKGDIYESFFLNQRSMSSIRKQATLESNYIIFNNIPSGALYLLKNQSKWKEERI